jgi:hypothetical protein
MGEREYFELSMITAEIMYSMLEDEYRLGKGDLDMFMHRLKDLSAFSLIRAEILELREGVEMLSLAMFFGITSDSRYHQNQDRLGLLSSESLEYQGDSLIVESEIAQRKAASVSRQECNTPKSSQSELF